MCSETAWSRLLCKWMLEWIVMVEEYEHNNCSSHNLFVMIDTPSSSRHQNRELIHFVFASIIKLLSADICMLKHGWWYMKWWEYFYTIKYLYQHHYLPLSLSLLDTEVVLRERGQWTNMETQFMDLIKKN